MKFEKINNTDYQLLFPITFFSEEEILAFVKKVLRDYQKQLNLKGFYRIIISNRTFGLFLQVMKVNDSYYKNTFDYRVIFDDDVNFYFQTKDYFAVEQCQYVYYFDGCFYALVDDSFDEILEKVEFGEFVLESSIDFLSQSDLIFHK